MCCYFALLMTLPAIIIVTIIVALLLLGVLPLGQMEFELVKTLFRRLH